MGDSTKMQVAELLFLALEDDISSEQIEQLNGLIKNRPELIRYTINFLQLNSALKFSRTVASMESAEIEDGSLLTEFFVRMAEYEKVAPEVEVLEGKPQPQLIQRVVYPPQQKRKLSKFSIFLFFNAAAILFFLLVLRLIPYENRVEVATLTDTYRAKWADVDGEMVKGTSIEMGEESLMLREGYAKFLFGNQAEVTIEGPAEFEVVSDDQIKLNYGRLYATVSPEAIGFIVKTPTAQIIDLGTEFGVDINFRGDTALHVTKGKTVLIAGDRNKKKSIEVSRGGAKRISADKQQITDIPCDDQLFVRDINSSHGLVWRGEMRISLADIVGGGNGFGTGQLNAGIEMASGNVIPSSAIVPPYHTGSAGARNVKSLPYIDSVFVPGVENRTSITSDGSIEVQFPRTGGFYWGSIFNGAFHESDNVPKHALKLGGVAYNSRASSAISIHPNQGITFDLSRIREQIPQGDIGELRSLVGISETVIDYVEEAGEVDREVLAETKLASAAFWVFVDGKKVWEKEVSNADGPVELQIPINSADRFLTLAVTEASLGYSFDWALFGKPELVIK